MTRLKILHTNDLHSHFDNYKKIVSLIREHRDADTIVLDGGDFADFKSIELQGTKGIAAIELLEAAGYDAITIGNNEMFNGVDTLEHMASKSTIPFISNNLMKKDKTAIQGVCKSTLLEKNGLRLLITGSSPDMGVFNEGLGLHMTDYTVAIKEEIHRNKGKYDVCILLSHVGTFADEPLANEIEEIDIIISAHDHKLFNEAKLINETNMNSAGNYGEYLGIVEIEVSDGKVQLINSQTIPTKEIQEDPQIVSILKVNKDKAINTLSQPLYSLALPLWHDVVEENPISNLIADGLKDMLKADIGLINSGICNAGIFREMSRKKLIEVCPSPLNPTLFEIQGKNLKEALESSLDAQICLAEGRGPGFRGRFVGGLHVSGLEIEHDGKHIKTIYLNEIPLEDEQWYLVASSDYLQRGSGYPSLANNRNEQYSAEEIKDIIEIYGEKSDFVESAHQNRWKELANIRG
ncbi:5'-nucleotidase C-terminal domain-containing protein [Psychrobacillus sp. FSL K6-2684]|uniref:bifunctional metallophosphatase/5'-nucleotidase n=1 Tax=Psychrobacillus sp. FSL K6-2684 TaxID=2921547 RepID=UPI0030F8459D